MTDIHTQPLNALPNHIITAVVAEAAVLAEAAATAAEAAEVFNFIK